MSDAPTSPPVPGGPESGGPPAFATALPPAGARILAFASIVVAGICGGLIGYGITDLQTGRKGGGAAALGGLIGAVLAAVGVAVVAVLVLRAMGEWHTIASRAAARGEAPPKPAKRPS